MTSPNSRYADAPTAIHALPDGREVVYLRRRFLPDPHALARLGVHTVVAGDRLDLVAARWLGDPELWWRVADANVAQDPAALTDTPGRRLRITLPAGVPGPSDA